MMRQVAKGIGDHLMPRLLKQDLAAQYQTPWLQQMLFRSLL
jgi:hypothetical protein